MSKKRIFSTMEYSTKVARLSPASKREIYAALPIAPQVQVMGAETAPGRAVRGTTELPRLSAMPYALITSVLSVGLLFLIRLFAAGGLPLPVFLLGSVGFVATGLMGCVVIAVKSWRAAVGMRQWILETDRPREWSWE